MSAERWKPVVGFEGRYEVSNLGRVRSLRPKREKVLRPSPDTNGGYFRVVLYSGSKRRHVLVHRLVLGAWKGAPAEGQEARHLNNDRTDNRVTNLAWGTRSDNIADMHRAGSYYSPRQLAARAARRAA